MTKIKVSNLQHKYPNGVVAVNNVNVEIEQGEQVSVVGQNGSGKTTVVKHWNGLLKPTQGNVFVGFDESADEIVLAVNQDPPTNTAISIASYADLQAA